MTIPVTAIASASLSYSKKPELSELRILLIGINYAPEPTGIAPYNTAIAEHLTATGASVKVVTGFPHYPSWTIPSEYSKRLSESANVNNVAVLRLRHYVPSVMTAARRVLYETSFLLHALVRTVHDRPDLILCVSPALAGGVAGALIGLRTGAPVVLIVQDLMAKATGESGIIGGRHAAGAASTLERFALSRASETVIVSESFRKPLHAYGIQPARIRLIRNWTHIRPATVSKQEARRALNWPEDDFLAVHTGNMGFKQDLENIIRASEESVESQVRYVLVGDGSQRTSLEAQAVGNPAIWFVNPVDEDTYPLVLAAADVLLLNERESVSNMSLPSKLTSYMVAGRPIVAAVAEGGATWRELTLAGAGLVVPAGNPTRLAQAIEHLRDDEELRSALSRAARTHAEHELSASSSLKEIVRLAKELTAGRVASRPSVTRTLLNRGWGRRV